MTEMIARSTCIKKSGSDDIVGPVVPTVFGIQDKGKQIPKKYASSSNISSVSSDSNSTLDNSSYLDDENNKREKEKNEKRLQEIYGEFYILKKMLYQEQMDEIENEFKNVDKNADEIKAIELHQMNLQLSVAEETRKLKIAALRCKHEAEEQTIRQSFENNKEFLYDTIKTKIKEKIQRLEESRKNNDVDAALWLDRSGPYRLVQPKIEPVTISAVDGPCIVHMLKEDELLEDWSKIKKMLS